MAGEGTKSILGSRHHADQNEQLFHTTALSINFWAPEMKKGNFKVSKSGINSFHSLADFKFNIEYFSVQVHSVLFIRDIVKA